MREDLINNHSIRETNLVTFPTPSNVNKNLEELERVTSRLGTKTLATRADYNALKYFRFMFVDKLHALFTFNHPISEYKRKKFEAYLKTLGMTLYRNFPKNYKNKGEVVFVAIQNGSVFIVHAVLMFNGISYLRRIWEGEDSKPQTVIGDNGFCDIDLYMEGFRGKPSVIEYLEKTVAKTFSIFNFFLNKRFHLTIDEVVSFKIKEIEYNYNFLTNAVSRELEDITKLFAEKFGKVQLEKDGKNIVGGVKATVDDGVSIKAYLKHENVIRVEVQRNRAFFKKFYKSSKGLSIDEIVSDLQFQSWRISNFVIPQESSTKEELQNPLGFIEAIIKLILVSGTKHFKLIARKLSEGNGHFEVRSKEKCYRSVLKLKKEGILKPSFKRGRYELSSDYKVIIDNNNIVQRFLDS